MRTIRLTALTLALGFLGCTGPSEDPSPPLALFTFDGTEENATDLSVRGRTGGDISFVPGLTGQAMSLGPGAGPASLTLDPESLPFGSDQDFSVQFWMRTTSDPIRQYVVLSKKEIPDNSLASQKHAGWAFYVSGGTWGWSMGSGGRRITYQRDNGQHMPLTDGGWHQLTMTYRSALSEVRLFYDGENWVTYHVSDSNGFDFTTASPLVVGWEGAGVEGRAEILPAIQEGADALQELVEAFNALGLDQLQPDELLPLVVDPEQFFEEKVEERAQALGPDGPAFRAAMAGMDLEDVQELVGGLMANPYTIHQVMNFMDTSPMKRVYALVDGRVVIRQDEAAIFAQKERFHPPEFEMDELAIWDRVLPPQEVMASYSEHFNPTARDLEEELTSVQGLFVDLPGERLDPPVGVPASAGFLRLKPGLQHTT